MDAIDTPTLDDGQADAIDDSLRLILRKTAIDDDDPD